MIQKYKHNVEKGNTTHKKTINELMKSFYDLQEKRESKKALTRRNAERRILEKVLLFPTI